MEMIYKPRFNKAGIDNSCWKCKCRQGRPGKKHPGICKCGHSHYDHRIVLKWSRNA